MFVEKEIFQNNDFDPAVFLNQTSSLGVFSIKWFRKIDKLLVAELKSISLSRLLSQGFCGRKDSICKVEFYDCLTTCSPRAISICINYIDADAETKQILEKCIHKRDEDLFIDTLINSGADYSNVACALMFFLSMKPILKTLPHFAEEANDDEVSIIDVLCYPNSNYASITEQVNLKSVFDWKKSLDIKQYNNIDWFALYSLAARRDYFYLYLHYIISNYCTDIDAVIKMSEFIQNNPDLRNAYERIESDELDVQEASSLELDTLVNFRKKFIDRLILPRAIEGKKKPTEYFVSNKEFRLEFVKNLYFTLVEERMLSYDDATYYSFVYRMDKRYKGEKDPDIIIWRGQRRELYHLIYWFVDEGDGRLWAKTAKFFVDKDGQKLKTNGVKNQAVTPTIRMERILKEFQAKFGQ